MGNQIGSEFFKTKKTDLTTYFKNKRLAIDGSIYIYKYCAIFRDTTGKLFSNGKGVVTAHLYGLINLIKNLKMIGSDIIFVFEGADCFYKTEETNRRAEHKAKAKAHLNLLYKTRVPDYQLIRRYEQQSFYITQDITKSTRMFLDYAGISYAYSDFEGEKCCYQLYEDGRADLIITDDWDICMYGGPVIRNMEWVFPVGGVTSNMASPRVMGEYLDVQRIYEQKQLTRSTIIDMVCVAGCDYTKGIPGYGPKKSLGLVTDPSFTSSQFYKNVITPIKSFILEKTEYLLVRPRLHKSELYKWLVTELNFSPDLVYEFISVMESY